MSIQELVRTIRREYGIDITEGEINSIATAINTGDQPYVELDDVLSVVYQLAENTRIARNHGLEEEVLEWLFPNEDGEILDERLDDLEEDRLLFE